MVWMSENFFEASLVSGYDLLFCHVYGPKSSSSQIIFQLQEKNKNIGTSIATVILTVVLQSLVKKIEGNSDFKMVNFLEMKITRSNKVVRDRLDYKTCQTWETLNMLSVPKTRPLFEPVDFPHTFLFWRNETLTWNFRSFNFLLCDVTVWSGRGWTFSGLASEESSMSFIFSLSWPNVHTWGGVSERALWCWWNSLQCDHFDQSHFYFRGAKVGF